jgi:hypothetical protein
MTAFDYLIISLPTFEAAKATQVGSASVDVLNHEGAAGWEAVGMSTLADLSVAVLFKRRSTEDHQLRRGRPFQRTT